ncbi:MAG: COX15/CtaA family protein [Gemmataceae bacterium]|nr:COX15/CtaA family protein [Gemmataceae bacterium]
MAATTTSSAILPTARWPCTIVHALAVLTVVAALPLLFLGAEVTTKGVGMADERSVVNPLQALNEFTGQSLGFRIEHSHRLAGWFVGLCGIALAGSLWIAESRRWLQWLGTAALLLIAAQGLLGIFRVSLNAWLGPTLAWVHGSFAPIVFATLVSVALCTSAAWSTPRTIADSPALRRWSIAMVGVVYLQLVLGGMVRHQGNPLVARGHLLGAFVAAAGLLWLVKMAREADGCLWTNRVILALLAVQVFLGVEAWFLWMKRVFLPHAGLEESMAMHWLRSGHYVAGTLLFAATVVLMLEAHRGARRAEVAA